MQFLSSGSFFLFRWEKILTSHQAYWWLRLQVVSWPSGEMDITFYKWHLPWWHAIQRVIVWIPLALSTAHWPSVLPDPRVYFWLCMLMDEISSESPVPTLVLLFKNNLFLNLENGSRLYFLSFVNSEWQRWRRKKGVAMFWSQAVTLLLLFVAHLPVGSAFWLIAS